MPKPCSHEFRENVLGVARGREHNVTNRADRERLGCSQDDVDARVGVLQSMAGLGLARVGIALNAAGSAAIVRKTEANPAKESR